MVKTVFPMSTVISSADASGGLVLKRNVKDTFLNSHYRMTSAMVMFQSYVFFCMYAMNLHCHIMWGCVYHLDIAYI